MGPVRFLEGGALLIALEPGEFGRRGLSRKQNGKNSIPESIAVTGLGKRWCGGPELLVTEPSKTARTGFKFCLKAPILPFISASGPFSTDTLSDADA